MTPKQLRLIYSGVRPKEKKMFILGSLSVIGLGILAVLIGNFLLSLFAIIAYVVLGKYLSYKLDSDPRVVDKIINSWFLVAILIVGAIYCYGHPLTLLKYLEQPTTTEDIFIMRWLSTGILAALVPTSWFLSYQSVSEQIRKNKKVIKGRKSDGIFA